jgi:hypothetical protein
MPALKNTSFCFILDSFLGFAAQRHRAQPLRPSERSERGSSRLERDVRRNTDYLITSGR